MGFGHLDFETGKWVNDPEESADAEDHPTERNPSVPDGDVAAGQYYGWKTIDGLPWGSQFKNPADHQAALSKGVPVLGPDARAGTSATSQADDYVTGPSSPPPMSLADKARLLKFIQDNAGDPAKVADARARLMRAEPTVPQVPEPMPTDATGNPGPLGPLPTQAPAQPLSLSDRAKLIRFVRSGQGNPADIMQARQLLARNP